MTGLGLALRNGVPGNLATTVPASSARTTLTPTPPAHHAPAHNEAAGSVRFEHVGKRYRSAAGDVVALKAIALTITPGSVFGIIGRSGAGKPSLLRTVNRLEKPSEGRVWVDDQDISALDKNALVALRRQVGMIFQHFNLLSAKTVFENVALPLQVAGVRPALIYQRVTELLHLVGLEGKEKSYPAHLSGGQKQRVGIARALVHHPRILLCDEATSALDPETTGSILKLLRDINQKLGLTIILITHEMGVIREICDTVAVLERGELVETGPVWQVFGQPRHAATQALLQPLAHGLPDDLTQSIMRHRETIAGAAQRVLALRYTGAHGRTPDFARIGQVLGHPVRLLHGGLDRIQGHSHGQLIVSAPADGPSLSALAASELADEYQELGYVAHHD